MKHIISTLLVASLATLMPHAAQAQDYRLVWSDEFDGTAVSANWNVVDNDSPYNNELQAYTSRPENVSVEDGNLVITARREQHGTRSFTSARLDTHGRVSFTHGRLVARIKLPRLANGLWPAFWMMGEELGEGAWPRCGEVDIMEAGQAAAIAAGTVERTLAGTMHWGESVEKHQMYAPGNVTVDADITGDGYHTYTMEWDETQMRFFLDDSAEPYFSKSIRSGFALSKYFHNPFYIILNLAVGGDYTGILSPSAVTALPVDGSEAKMLVDYVRLYQKVGSENVTTGIGSVADGAAATAAPGSAQCFNLMGQAVDPATARHGIYVTNGRKVALR